MAVTKSGPLMAPPSSPQSAAPKVKVEVSTNWKADKKTWAGTINPPVMPQTFSLPYVNYGETREVAPEPSLAASILQHPLPKHWEVRRTKDKDVFFINTTSEKTTASLWWDPLPPANRPPLPVPLPLDWWQSIISGKPSFTQLSSGKTFDVRPPGDEKSKFISVLCYKEYCEITEFFPQNLTAQYIEDAKPKRAVPRYLRTA